MVLLLVIAGLATTQATAHHSWSAAYDVSRSTFVSGTVTRVMLRNPHSALVLNVTADNGVTERMLRVGEQLFVTGNPHRDAKVKSLRALSVRRADDGTELGADRPDGR